MTLGVRSLRVRNLAQGQGSDRQLALLGEKPVALPGCGGGQRDCCSRKFSAMLGNARDQWLWLRYTLHLSWSRKANFGMLSLCFNSVPLSLCFTV